MHNDERAESVDDDRRAERVVDDERAEGVDGTAARGCEPAARRHDEEHMMQRMLGAQWQQLAPALRAHYQATPNADIGTLDIEYPRAMQPLLNVLRLIGVLVNRRSADVPTVVEKFRCGERHHWRRRLSFTDGQVITFESHWEHKGGNELIEYVNPFLGLCMAAHVEGDSLHYEGRYYLIRVGRVRLKVPEWLALGHTTIVEQAIGASDFAMDFRLHHPLFGQIYRYAGRFRTESLG